MVISIKKTLLASSLLLSIFLSTSNLSVKAVGTPTPTPSASPTCNLTSGNPADLVNCASPEELKGPEGPTTKARNLGDIINVINNALAALAVFFSIIGALVGSINMAKSQGSPKDLDEAKQTLTNSILAFVITVSVWYIVNLVLKTTGLQ